MCVIFYADTDRPTPEMVEQAFDTNPDGGGVAWRDNGYVKWKKGLKLAEMQDLVASLPLPLVAHFRIPSCGGKYDVLCHPFPIDKRVSLDLEGQTKGYVLFHNGHWGKWKDTTLDAAAKRGNLPIGRWSDSRAMAWMASIYGLGILELIDEKAVVFGPNDYEIFPGTGFSVVNGVWVSNTHWQFRRTRLANGQGSYYERLPEVYRRDAEKSKTIADLEAAPKTIIDGEVVKSESLVKVSAGEPGGALTQLPFVPQPHRGAAVMSVTMAKKLFEEGNLSKKKYKKIRKHWERAWAKEMKGTTVLH